MSNNNGKGYSVIFPDLFKTGGDSKTEGALTQDNNHGEVEIPMLEDRIEDAREGSPGLDKPRRALLSEEFGGIDGEGIPLEIDMELAEPTNVMQQKEATPMASSIKVLH